MTELIGERSERSSTATLQALLEHSREGIALVGADGVILYANPAIAQVLGSAADESIEPHSRRRSASCHSELC
jgi:PAS domain S-box-containing protein